MERPSLVASWKEHKEMAFDSETKRASAINFGAPRTIALPPPNQKIYLGAREQLLGCYAFERIGPGQEGQVSVGDVGIGVGV